MDPMKLVGTGFIYNTFLDLPGDQHLKTSSTLGSTTVRFHCMIHKAELPSDIGGVKRLIGSYSGALLCVLTPCRWLKGKAKGQGTLRLREWVSVRYRGVKEGSVKGENGI